MSSKGSDSRERLVEAALRLLSRQGYRSTVVKDIARAGAAPMGSFYYHFPGGKEEIGAAAMRRGAAQVGAKFAGALAAHDDPAEAVAACALVLADGLETTAWEDGCPVATTALETIGQSTLLQDAAADAFAGWQRQIADRLRRHGCSAAVAGNLALTAVSLIEGAEMIARVHGSREALERAADALRVLVRATLTAD
jgi:TetR/AcrR family transcriptional regulator, lmrAB and yxaGH operons repressor